MGQKKIKCYSCGGDVLIGADSHIGICSCCGAEIPVPDEGFSAVEAYSAANELLSQSRFEQARDIFQDILAEAPFEAAAYWGFAVSEYGIEYVEDPATGEMLPTLHRLSLEEFSKQDYVKKAIEYAPDYETKQFYETSSRLIDSIQSKSLEISQKEEPYDIFICYKQTEEGEKRTADSRMAADFYRELTRRGYKVFFAEQTLSVGVEYEPRIYAALQSARVMIAIASKAEYYRAVWVQNEWSRYADLIRRDKEKGVDGRLLIPMFRNMSREDLPNILRDMPEYVDMDSLVNPRQELLRLVSEHFSRGLDEEDSKLRRQVRGSAGPIRMQESAEKYRTRGTISLVNGEFDEAKEMFGKAMHMEPSGEAALGLMMCSLKIPGREALHRYDRDIRNAKYFKQALSYASDAERAEYEKIAENCLENQRWSGICQKKRSECENVVKSLAEEAQTQTLCREAEARCQTILTQAEKLIKAKEWLQKNGRTVRLTELYLVGANLIPAFLLVLFGFLEENFPQLPFPRIGSSAATGVMAFVSMILLFLLLGRFETFRGGVLRFLFRLAISYGVPMIVFAIAVEAEHSLAYLVVCAVGCLIFYRADGGKLYADRRLVKAGQDLMPTGLYQELSEQLKQGADRALEERTGEYRQYYQADADWETACRGWKDTLYENSLGILEKARAKAQEAAAR